MKQAVFLFVAMLLATAGATAKSVVFTLSNNTKVYYLLGGETAPMLRFADDGKVTIDADEYSISGIKNFYISETDDPNAIEQTLARQDISYTGNTLVVKATEATAVKVCTAGGATVKADIQRTGDTIAIDLNRLQRGIYMIQIGTSSMKVLKK